MTLPLFPSEAPAAWLAPGGATRAAGLRQWKAFQPHLSAYAARRNHVDEDSTGVSQLSPWLNRGLLTEAELTREALERHSFPTIEKFLQELYWRRYWRGYLSLRPGLWKQYEEAAATATESDHAFIQRLEAGEAPVAIMGYFARSLVERGYLHNHARMWFAAWWVHVERRPWELGAQFFLKHLIDGDPAVNTLSWRWVAGLHTKGKSYLARPSNLRRYLSPSLLSQYSGGLERLSDITPIALPETELTPPPRATVTPSPALPPQLAETANTILLFEHDLDLQGLEPLLHPGLRAVHLLRDSRLEEQHAEQRNHWQREAVSETRKELQNRGYESEIHDLADEKFDNSIRSTGSVLLCEPEIGPYTAAFHGLLARHTATQPYQAPQRAQLNSFATAGFFGFWKKTKKQLQLGTI